MPRVDQQELAAAQELIEEYIYECIATAPGDEATVRIAPDELAQRLGLREDAVDQVMGELATSARVGVRADKNGWTVSA